MSEGHRFRCHCGSPALTTAGFCPRCGIYWAEHDHEPDHDLGEAQAVAAAERAEAFFEIEVAKYDADTQTWRRPGNPQGRRT